MRSKFRPGSRSLLRATTYFGTSLVNYHYAAIRELEVRTGKKILAAGLNFFLTFLVLKIFIRVKYHETKAQIIIV